MHSARQPNQPVKRTNPLQTYWPFGRKILNPRAELNTPRPISHRHHHNWESERFILAVLAALIGVTAFIVLIHLGSA